MSDLQELTSELMKDEEFRKEYEALRAPWLTTARNRAIVTSSKNI